MKRHVNLMTEAARFRVAARLNIKRWGLALAVLGAALTPVAIIRSKEARRVRNEQEALEASYEPMRRLIKINRDLRAEGASLVRDDRLALELSHSRPVGALLGVVSAAAAESQGELFVEHLGINQRPPGAAGAATPPAANGAAEQHLVIEAAATLTYDIARFVESLKAAPVKSVKVTADVVASQDGVDRKNYTIECTF